MAKSTSFFFFLHIPTNTYMTGQRNRYNYHSMDDVRLTDKHSIADTWKTLDGIFNISGIIGTDIKDQFCILETDLEYNELRRISLAQSPASDIVLQFEAFADEHNIDLTCTLRKSGSVKITKDNHYGICKLRKRRWFYQMSDSHSSHDIDTAFATILEKWS